MFRAPCGGDTTKSSKYPRSELRELDRNGKPAAWSSDDDQPHFLKVELAITATPPKKQHVVCAQVHDAEDDVLMIRLEKRKLFVERNSTGDVTLDENYELGKRVQVTLRASRGSIAVEYNGEQKLSWKTSRSGCYFKAGCYTQSNPARGDAAESAGEVMIYRIEVE